MTHYLITKCVDGSDAFTKVNEDGTTYSFSQTSAPTDYQAFLKYQAEGGKVYGADEEVPDGQATE